MTGAVLDIYLAERAVAQWLYDLHCISVMSGDALRRSWGRDVADVEDFLGELEKKAWIAKVGNSAPSDWMRLFYNHELKHRIHHSVIYNFAPNYKCDDYRKYVSRFYREGTKK